MKEIELGGLRARVTGGIDGNGGGDGPVVVLMHGFGAPGDDLVPLWREIQAPKATRWVFPAAPLSLDFAFTGSDARAWWLVDLDRRVRAVMAGKIEELLHEDPQGIVPARNSMLALLDDVELTMGVTGEKLVLGGFSQGAMLACDIALRTDRPLAALVLLSGTILAMDTWREGLLRRKGLPVFISHGDGDPLLPFSIAERLRAMWVDGGARVTWVPFRGGHGIASEVVDGLGEFLTGAMQGLPDTQARK